ncbi:hypothetical protein PsYK624_110400 [Phanerochaete sordida]|uniref:DUF7918 domain-containing protein n=1 Tax=Phanerochaete sordida TaxID=48140 RepID=A0A9P3GJV3_9APHY|nr:hypothetical protein PsYK624_110400 [Phanerochaete sordida]
MKWNDLEVSIISGSSDVFEEYDVANVGENEMACWVISEEDKEFVIKVKNTHPDVAVSSQVELDGRVMDRALWPPRTGGEVGGAWVSPSSLRRFRFGRINISDDDTLLKVPQDAQKLEAIGTICLKFRRFKLNGTKSVDGQPRRGLDTTDIGVLHERRKKVGVHVVSLGEEVVRPKPMCFMHGEYVDTIDDPQCVFIFRYRPKGMLQALGVIPLSPPEPNPPRSEKRPRERSASVEIIGTKINDGHGLTLNELEAKKAAAAAEQAHYDMMISSLREQRNGRRKRIKREHSSLLQPNDGDGLDVLDLTSNSE